MSYSVGRFYANELKKECGIEDLISTDIKDLLAYRGILLIEEDMNNADGRIIHGKSRSLIKINKDIEYEGRKRFTIAHELGHYEMHRDYPIHSDSKSLDWFDSALKKLKYGKQELEANEFASELLMPAKKFREACHNKKFGPNLLRYLSEHFMTSITSVAFKCVELNIHPICLFFISKNKIKYWKKSDSLNCWVTDRNQMEPHANSVAMEFIEADYDPEYSKEESVQEVEKSVWFTLNASSAPHFPKVRNNNPNNQVNR